MLKIQRVHPFAKIPTRGSPESAGLDLSSVENVTIHAGERTLIDTGLRMILDPNHYARIAPRSGLALKHGIDVLAGVIDSDYRLNVKVLLQNHGKEPLDIKVGDRIAQLIITKIVISEPVEVAEMTQSLRTGGFGSTGV